MIECDCNGVCWWVVLHPTQFLPHAREKLTLPVIDQGLQRRATQLDQAEVIGSGLSNAQHLLNTPHVLLGDWPYSKVDVRAASNTRRLITNGISLFLLTNDINFNV